MTPREFLAAAVMLSTNYDERLMLRAQVEMDRADYDEEHELWREHYEDDAQRVGAKRVLWLEAQPC